MGDKIMVTESQLRANNKYKKKAYDQLNIRLRKDGGEKQKFQDYADSLDMSLAKFITASLNYIIDHGIKP